MLTILCTAQLIILQLTSDETLPKLLTHWLLIGANSIGIIVAQIKKNAPPKAPPRKKKRP